MSETRKTAVVTGGSRGIGRAICIKLAQEGMNLVIGYAGNEQLAEQTKEQCEQFGASVVLVKGDVSDSGDCQTIFSAASEHFGSVDLLVNNAGITKDTLIVRMTEEDFDRVIEVNLKGAFNCMKQAAKIMMKQRSGRIINISSVVGITGNAGQSNYAASKAGIIGVTKSLARELAGRGITVNAVAPGFIQTDMTDSLNDDIKQKVLQNIPLRRFGQGSDVAELVAFIASDKAAYITGQVINVDGGMVMC